MESRTIDAAWVVVLGGAALGYATSDAAGAALATISVAVALGLAFGVTWTLDRFLGRPANPDRRVTVAGAVGIATAFALGAGIPVAGYDLPLWGLAGVVFGLGVALGTAGDDFEAGCWHAVSAGGFGGVLAVYGAIWASFTMRPELTGIVAISAVVLPLGFALVAGLGGLVGAASVRTAPLADDSG